MTNKTHTNIVLLSILILGFIIILLVEENIKLRCAVPRLKAANGGNMGRDRIAGEDKLYNNIEYDTGVPKKLLQTGGIIENSGNFLEFGIKRLPEYCLKYPIDEWQVRAAARIYTQEAFKLILSDKKLFKRYCRDLAARYCKNNKQYGGLMIEIYEAVSK
jgi:hypothetical protein